MITRLKTYGILVLILSLVLSGCGPAVEPITGHWEGQTEDGSWNIGFDYDTAGQISNVGIEYNNTQIGSCLFQISTITLSSSNSFNQKIAEAELAQGAGIVGKISGKFNSESTISGKLSVDICGRTVFGNEKGLTWTATQKSALAFAPSSLTAFFIANGFSDSYEAAMDGCNIVCKVFVNQNGNLSIYLTGVGEYGFILETYDPSSSENEADLAQLQKVLTEASPAELANAVMEAITVNTTASVIQNSNNISTFEGTTADHDWSVDITYYPHESYSFSSVTFPGSNAVKIIVSINTK